MAQHQNRSNHVRVDNLPPNMTDCRELLSQMELAGNVQDLVAISSTWDPSRIFYYITRNCS